MSSDPLCVLDLGRMPYGPCMDLQRRTHEAVLARSSPPTLLLVEHDPVITISQRRGAGGHVLRNADELAWMGIDMQPTDRGGDVTYHGPGQLVAYPILRLGLLGLNIGRYMRFLEQVVIDTVAPFGVKACHEPGYTGVWLHDAPSPPQKLCALGVRVRRNVTMHGLALNVSPNLDHYQTIVPCGLVGRGVTSLRRVLNRQTPPMDQVKAQLVHHFQRHLSALTANDRPLAVS